MNNVHLVGVIASPIKVDEYPGKEPGELKVKARFLMGVRRPGGERRDGDLIRVETWGNQARNLVRFNAKGSKVAVSGRIRSDFYNPEGIPNGGQLRSAVVADRIEYLSQRVATPGEPISAEEPVAKAGRR